MANRLPNIGLNDFNDNLYTLEELHDRGWGFAVDDYAKQAAKLEKTEDFKKAEELDNFLTRTPFMYGVVVEMVNGLREWTRRYPENFLRYGILDSFTGLNPKTEFMDTQIVGKDGTTYQYGSDILGFKPLRYEQERLVRPKKTKR